MCSSLATKPLSSTQSLIVIFIGPPGAGKGTHAEPLGEHLGIPHISTGELFRNHIRTNTLLGKIADKYISQGKLVPDELTLDMLFARLSEPDCKKGCILDGFPRTAPQANAFAKRLDPSHKVAILHFCIDDASLIQRIVGRLSCKECGASYHIRFNPPQNKEHCDRCHTYLYQRADDTEELLRKRLDAYRKQTEPVIEYYEKKGHFFREICGSGTPQEVYLQVLQALANITNS